MAPTRAPGSRMDDPLKTWRAIYELQRATSFDWRMRDSRAVSRGFKCYERVFERVVEALGQSGSSWLPKSNTAPLRARDRGASFARSLGKSDMRPAVSTWNRDSGSARPAS